MPPRRSARRPAARALPVPERTAELTIEQLGAQGHGIAGLDGQTVYVPYTLPGERVVARLVGRRGEGLLAELQAVLTPARERRLPPCPHFGSCGGCSLQHLDPAAQAAFKTAQIRQALARRGLDPAILSPLVSPPHSRRRATLAARRVAAGLLLGFNAMASDRIVPVETCPVLLPALEALLPSLRAVLQGWLPPAGTADVTLTAADSGIDLVLGGGPAPDLGARERLADFAADQDLARLSWGDEPIAARRQVVQRFAGTAVALPPGGFLQATAEGEAAIIAAVLAELGEGAVADLFAGCGTLSFPIAAAGHPVVAVEGAEATWRALSAAARSGSTGVRAEQRDLDRSPLAGAELARFSAVVFDPPRAGAAAQSAALAASRVPLVVAVSCNPATFARDARTLVDGGYRLEAVQPIDQFLWSGHVELVAAFRRV